MKILYGVQGTGNGHITRARVMAQAFSKRQDVKVDFLFSGRPEGKYFDMQVFGQYQCRRGLTFVNRQGAIDRWQTLRSAKPRELLRDIKALDLSQYDLVLNDFEPITAWAARKQQRPCISISHQASFTHNIPKLQNSVANRLLMKYFAPANIHLGVHWYHFGHAIMPPFVEDEQSHNEEGKDILVYLPFEDLQDIAALLDPITEVNFICFHPDVDKEVADDHIHWRRPCKDGFHQVLQQSAGVIANGGFELSSECLKLGKKLLLKPLKGQFEQLSNVLTLEQLGLCQSMNVLDTEEVEQWLEMAPAEPIGFPSDPQLLIDWLLTGEWQDTRSICQQLWQQVDFPEPLKRRLENLTPA
ncbi:MJ1255/VC2487 family glycosyltransferase [Lacimicrobium alkaliphilum]|uniref:Glycosyl transferase n=1 Tax=Lacimicrobium alkaliphilum TaxID=1526571 RepID=A0ABQ1R9V9_9ALTE|nr:MJ1255/VC2487 family glycosyltransferase [Lacimicrobium alkaliphilum]GGD62623.1 glycosyl transferase [Lacimicrobium alkaliphilum]